MQRMIRYNILACSLLTVLAAGAFAQTGGSSVAQGQSAAEPAIDCSGYLESGAPLVFYDMDPNVAPSLPATRIVRAPGVSIPINVGRFDPRQGIELVPAQCFDWTASPAEAVQVTDGGSTLIITQNATPDSELILSGQLFGSQGEAGTARLRIVIANETERRLIGTWSFAEARSCAGVTLDPPLEIRFEAENGMSVTWTPFERYWDYWGRYSWSPDTGAFTLEATGGNQVPADIDASGHLVIEDERHLSLSGVHFGTRESGASSSTVSAAEAGCTLVFRRQGAAL